MTTNHACTDPCVLQQHVHSIATVKMILTLTWTSMEHSVNQVSPYISFFVKFVECYKHMLTVFLFDTCTVAVTKWLSVFYVS